jgi:hypothetical protein
MDRLIAGCVGLLSLCATLPASSATLSVHQSPNTDLAVVRIEGELTFGDQDRFAEIALKIRRGVVVLTSTGGNLVAGIEIGKAIRLKGFGP